MSNVFSNEKKKKKKEKKRMRLKNVSSYVCLLVINIEHLDTLGIFSSSNEMYSMFFHIFLFQYGEKIMHDRSLQFYNNNQASWWHRPTKKAGELDELTKLHKKWRWPEVIHGGWCPRCLAFGLWKIAKRGEKKETNHDEGVKHTE